MTETKPTPQGGETWEEFLAEDVEYTKLNEQRSELDGHIRKYEGLINDIEWRLLGKLETLQIMQTKLIELEKREKEREAKEARERAKDRRAGKRRRKRTRKKRK